ncbi:glycosyltransferase [Bacteroides sp. SL.2.06]|jgi:glycosyl transferase cpsJ|uniref:Glycosyltransferase family 2 protein n=1 Tax=Bacteroides xylanisolvens TaxID=371601 RepID=A0A412VZ29_9BACE|nr:MULTISPECIES: glycosyltransferase family 2 protein [Bacteroides]MCQ4810506.1 glycosyltransferase [Bacteroides sp. SL.2.06]RGV15226.1 glycosyltransferase family 2 protein [Bacteroides xylanisolvens]RHK99387.1 glycosyltransferase family 2 protein [Bacteroides xylanisolvens]
MKPLISIIVPVYNVEMYLAKCVDSILAQTYTNLEIFLVNDGSFDCCGKLCDEYAKEDKRIKVIHKKNGGLSDARNVAIDVATGEFITFIDSDDYVTDDYIMTLYSLIEKYECKVSIALYNTFVEGSKPKVVNRVYREDCQTNIKAIEEMFYQEKYDTASWAKLYHSSLFATGIRYPKGIVYEDLATTYLLIFQSDKVAFCNRRIYNYLLRRDSIEGSSFSSKKMDSALKVCELMESHLDILGKVMQAYQCRMMSFFFHLLLKMPDGYEHRNMLYKRIKAIRWSVLCNSRARKKARVASLLSYFGLGVVKGVFHLIDRR